MSYFWRVCSEWVIRFLKPNEKRKIDVWKWWWGNPPLLWFTWLVRYYQFTVLNRYKHNFGTLQVNKKSKLCTCQKQDVTTWLFITFFYDFSGMQQQLTASRSIETSGQTTVYAVGTRHNSTSPRSSSISWTTNYLIPTGDTGSQTFKR